MSCRHDLANGGCVTCYPKTGTVDPGPEENYGPNLDGPGAVPRPAAHPQEPAREPTPKVGEWYVAAPVPSPRGDDAVSRPYSHYFRACPFDAVDVYRVLLIFGVTDPCLQHALKKVLCGGARGAKDQEKDVAEAIADASTVAGDASRRSRLPRIIY